MCGLANAKWVLTQKFLTNSAKKEFKTKLLNIISSSVSDPDHLAGSGSTSENVDPNPGRKNKS